jgi:hypothetical protein
LTRNFALRFDFNQLARTRSLCVEPAGIFLERRPCIAKSVARAISAKQVFTVMKLAANWANARAASQPVFSKDLARAPAVKITESDDCHAGLS